MERVELYAQVTMDAVFGRYCVLVVNVLRMQVNASAQSLSIHAMMEAVQVVADHLLER